MSSPADINNLALRTTNFPPTEPVAPTTFLSLIPLTSASYPRQQPSQPQQRLVSPPTKPVESPRQRAEELEAGILSDTKTRSDSLDSVDAAAGAKSLNVSVPIRFLKLGPVHWGAPGDDWSEVE